jgi:hypothetical protein
MKKSLLFTIGLFVCLVFTSLKPTEVNPFRVYPYLQVYGDGKVQLTWFSNSLTASTIKLVTTAGSILQQSNVEAESVPEIYYTTNEKNQTINGLEQGSWLGTDQAFRYQYPIDLPSGTTIEYVVTLAGSIYSGNLTMPSSKESWKKIRFIALSDSETDPAGRVIHRAWYPGKPLFRPFATPALWKEKFGTTTEQGIEIPNYFLTEEKGYFENLKIINSRSPNFIIMPGDLVQGGGYQPGWDEFFRHNAGELGKGLTRYPIIPALGNWEAFGGINGSYGTNEKGDFLPVLGRKRFHAYFETPQDDPLQKHRQSYYRVDYGPVTILTLDSSNGTPDQTAADFEDQPKLTGKQFTVPGTDTQENYTQAQYNAAGGTDLSGFGPGSDQYIWLEENLKNASQNGQIIFVQYHHIAYSSGEHGVPLNHELSIGQVGTPMRVINPLLEEYGVVAVFSGHDEIFERSFVDEDNDGKGIMYYDVGVAGDGMRGEKRDWLGNPFNTLDYNPYRKWTADQSSAEVWNTSGTNPVLTDGGKHYGHLEVNLEKVVEGDQEFALVNFTPVYSFPVLDQNYNLQKVERRVYNDEVSLKIPLRKLEFEPEVKDSVAIYLDRDGKATLTSLDFLKSQPEIPDAFTYQSSLGFEFDCEKIGLNEVTITSKNTDTNQEWVDELRLYVLDTIAPEFDAANATYLFDPVVGKISISIADFDVVDFRDNCPTNFWNITMDVNGVTNENEVTCSDIYQNPDNPIFEFPVVLTATDPSGNSFSKTVKVIIGNVVESKKVSLSEVSPLYEGKKAEIKLGDELEYEVLGWYRQGTRISESQIKALEISEPGSYYAVLMLKSGCTVQSNSLLVQYTEVNYPPVKERVVLSLDEEGKAELLLEDVFQSWPPSNPKLTVTLSKSSFNCEDIGAQVITVIIKDDKGNTWEEKVEVVVQDILPPVLTVKNIEVELDLTVGGFELAVEDFIESMRDNCSVATLTINKQNLTCEDIGKEVTVEIRAEDSSGNVTEKTAKVFVTSKNTSPVTITGSSTICGGVKQTLTLQSNAAFEVLRWIRNGTEVTGAKGISLEIDIPGNYYAVVRYTEACLFETEIFEVKSASTSSPVIISGSATLCAGEKQTLTLESEAAFEVLRWRRNGTEIIGAKGKTLEILEGGSYQAVVQNAGGCLIESNTFIVETTAIKPVLIKGSATLCAGEKQTLTLESEATFEVLRWRRNGTEIIGAKGKTLEILEGGSYQAVVQNAGGCLIESNTFIVETTAIKPVLIKGSATLCAGAKQTLTLESEAAFEVLRWRRNGMEITGAKGKTLEILEGGSYQAVVQNAGGCLIESAKLEVASIALPSGVIVENGNILSAPEGNFTYQWYRNGDKIEGATQRKLTVNQMGEFAVELTNEAGCMVRLAPVTLTISGIFNPSILISEELKIYPNPASSEVKVQALGDLEFAEKSMRIYNSTGADVSSSVEVIRQSSTEVSLGISRLAAGNYVIMVESSDNRIFLGKLIKQ